MHHIKFFGLVKLSDSNVKCNSYTNKFNLVFFLRVKGSGLFFFFLPIRNPVSHFACSDLQASVWWAGFDTEGVSVLAGGV